MDEFGYPYPTTGAEYGAYPYAPYPDDILTPEQRASIIQSMFSESNPAPPTYSGPVAGRTLHPETQGAERYLLPEQLSNQGYYNYPTPSALGDIANAKIFGVTPAQIKAARDNADIARIKNTDAWNNEFNRIFQATGDVNAAKASADNAIMLNNPGVSSLFDTAGEAAVAQQAARDAANRSLAQQYTDPNSTYGYGDMARGPFTYGTGGDTFTTYNSQASRPDASVADAVSMALMNTGNMDKVYDMVSANKKAELDSLKAKTNLASRLLYGGGSRGSSGSSKSKADKNDILGDPDKLLAIAQNYQTSINSIVSLMKSLAETYGSEAADLPAYKDLEARLNDYTARHQALMNQATVLSAWPTGGKVNPPTADKIFPSTSLGGTKIKVTD